MTLFRVMSPIAKATIAKQIARAIDGRGLTLAGAGRVTHEAISQLSLISTGKLEGFSTERLLRVLTRLGHDVEISIRRSKRRWGTVRVTARGAKR